MSIRLIQLGKAAERAVALVEEPHLRLLRDAESIYALADESLQRRTRLSSLATEKATREVLDYDSVYEGDSEWHILPAIDHPGEPARCLVSGTGLTHLGSARDRQSMHSRNSDTDEIENLTDSMKMFRWGRDGGRPAAGQIGVSPEWFFKGTGRILRAHGEPLEIPDYAEDGGEEAEVAGVYLISPEGQPVRIGMTQGNEFSDHNFEKRNYLYLASSKLRSCAIGPELVVDPKFYSVPGKVSITRRGDSVWSRQIRTGEAEMCHNLQNIEHHHFKFDDHRHPGDIHVHFFGADCLSYGEGVRLAGGDLIEIHFEGFGRPLCSTVSAAHAPSELVRITSLE
ncbi:MAG TPA: AraD1 family protein [Terriglobales bacterium]|nr:AraD1 family protein [Terriglobales bacterium]